LDDRVVEPGGWCDIWNIEERSPDRAGVYLFADVGLQVKYVGKAGAGRLRAEALDAARRGKDRGATKANWLAANSNDSAWSLEADLRAAYGPPNNLT